MKVIIDIPKKDYDKMCKGELINTILVAIKNGTPIPDNATNGDILKMMFPNIESRLDEKTDIILVKWTDGTTKTFKANWWNAPYTKEVEE